MELRVLRYFVTVAQLGSITQASQLLHLTQPTLSRQLQQLEDELGVKLFLRGKRYISLTDEGMLLNQRAKELLDLADKTQREFWEHKTAMGGTVAIGSGESMAAHILAAHLKNFSGQYPEIKYDLYNGNADDIKEKIDKGLLDMGFLLEPVDVSKYEYLRLDQQEAWGVLMLRNDPLARKAHVTPKDLAEKQVILSSRSLVQNEISGWFGSDYDRMRVFATYNLLSTATLLVENGLGYAVCLQSDLTIRENTRLCFRPLSPAHVTRCVVVWKKNQVFSSAAYRFLASIYEDAGLSLVPN